MRNEVIIASRAPRAAEYLRLGDGMSRVRDYTYSAQLGVRVALRPLALGWRSTG